MNFNVYVNKKTGAEIAQIALNLNRSRNSIINEALKEWLENHTTKKWPKDFFSFPAIDDVPDFKKNN
jgi:hypothetical protein